jgi:amino acid adenylation domain-containing protein
MKPMQTDPIQGFRLSPLQEHLWQLQLDSQKSAYRACCAVLIRGPLREDALKEALAAVVERHEILRTTFRYVPDLKMPVQIIGGQGANWADEVICQSSDALETMFEAWRTEPSAEDAGAQLRLRLLKIDHSNRVLLLSLPALCADTIAISNLVEEIAGSYSAIIDGTSDPVSPLQYADVAEWQRELIQSPEHRDGAEYWSKLGVVDASGDRLIFRKGASDAVNFQPAVFRTTLDAGLSKRIETIAGSVQKSPADFLLACWSTLLAKLTGKITVAVGLRVDGRSYDELKSSIGLFEKYAPAKLAITSDSAFLDVLSGAGRAASEAARWQDYLQPGQIASGDGNSQKPSCLPWAFDYGVEDSVYKVGDTVFSIVEKWACTDRFALKLSCVKRAESLSLQLHFDSNLFDRDEIALLSERLSVLIESACGSPESGVDDLAIIGPLELQRVLRDFNRIQPGYTPQRCLHDLIREQAARTPHAIAAVFGSESLSYAEMDRRSDQLARYLNGIGVGPESLVAVCTQRSPSLVVALLGILKAGGAYVPLDPAYPLNRLDFMIRDSGAAVLLTESALMSKLPPIKGTVLFLDSDLSDLAGLDTEPFRKAVCPENLAYVIYTSGSTGTPKGVAIQHSSAVALLEWACETYTADELSMLLASTSICFDLSVFELFVPLSIGATAVLCENVLDISALQQAQVTLINTVPSAMAALARIGELPRSVRAINMAGETLRGAVARRAYEIGNVEKVYNLYGPSEDTTYSTYTWVERECLDELTIGRPLSNTNVYVLEHRLQLVPIGVEGEIYIAGQGLSRCYLNRPDITAERFLPDPFGAQHGARMYRTGDIGRYLSDGNLDFVGRADHQIKISGFRIELGEIEAVLLRHPSVREVAVVAMEHQNGDKQLVAYFVAESGEQPSHEKLRAYLRQYLPDYMLPASFVRLDSLPLTANGKLDRRALPVPNQEAIVTHAPQTVIEKAIAMIWAEVLQLSAVGVETDFFEIGGHSLLATQIVARVRDVFQYDLPLRAMFEARTVSAIAKAILGDGTRRREMEDSAQRFLAGEMAAAGLVRRRPADGELIPLSFAQQRLWFIDQLEPGITAYNICGAVRLTGRIDLAALFKSFDEVVRRHEVLRTSFLSIDGRPEQVIRPAHQLEVDQSDLSDHSDTDSEVLKALSDEAMRPFDLSSGPLLRVKLLKLAEDKHVLLVTMHHIISDGWSIGIFIREFATLYNAFADRRESPLPELDIQYADFAQWQHEWLQGELPKQQLEYWQEQLGGELPVIELPFDRPRPVLPSYRGAHFDLRISSSVTEELRSLSRQHGVTMFMTMVAAFNVLLHRYGGREDIVVGTPIANRNRSEIESLIGFFTNTLVLRTDLSGRPSFITLLNRVRDVALAAYARQDLPFEKLVEELHPERNLSYHPLFQVMVVFQNTPMAALDLEGLKLEPLEIIPQHSKFDLTLELSEDAEGLQGRIIYSTDLFDAATVERLTDNFKTLLESIVANPEALVSNLRLLTDAEQEQVLLGWNSWRAPYAEACVHRLIEASVEQSPAAIAAVCGDVQLTYGELNKRANQLARYLRALGVAAESRVGVCFEPGVNMLVALLGVMKSGGVYLPLDPGYPQDRLAFLIDDARMSVVVAEERVRPAIPEGHAVCVSVDGDWAAVSGYPADNLSESAESENAAYVLYTSGSTGKPKGVIIEHRQLINYVMGISGILALPAGGAFAMVQPLTFDSCVTAIYPSLVAGGVLHLIPRQVALDSEAIGEYYTTHEIDYLKITPSHLEALMANAEQPGKVLPKRCVVIGGERLSWDLVKRIRAAAPGGGIRNHYGPTETTVGVVTRAVEEEIGLWSSVPIGRPIPNVRLYILDQHLQPVPVGATGELYIGGSCLARGYLERPELTAGSFIPDPFATEPGARLYKTGDLVHYLPGGEVEFLGRADHQLKIRGYRIELAEIEAALRECRGVREVAVLAHEYARAEKRLVAYIAADDPASLAVDGLWNHLKSKLPAYMVPASLVTVDRLPLNRRGKIDRERLLALYRELPAAEPVAKTSRAGNPRDVIELRLARIWEEVLGLDRIGLSDDFFDLGGHSLLAVRLIAAVRKEFATNLPLAAIFHAPTVEGMARLLRGGQLPQNQVLVPVHVKTSARPFFCVHAAGGSALAFVELARRIGDDITFYGFQSPLLGQQSNGHKTTIEELAARYLEELRRVQPQGPYAIGGWSMGGVVAFEMARQLSKAGEQVSLLALIDSVAPASNGRSARINRLDVMAGVAQELGILDYLEYHGEQLESEQELTRLLDRAKSKGLIPPELSPAHVSHLIKVYSTNVEATSYYQPQTIPVKPTLFKASERLQEHSTDPTLGWATYCPNGVEVLSVPGNHFSIVREPGVQALAEKLRSSIYEASGLVP